MIGELRKFGRRAGLKTTDFFTGPRTPEYKEEDFGIRLSDEARLALLELVTRPNPRGAEAQFLCLGAERFVDTALTPPRFSIDSGASSETKFRALSARLPKGAELVFKTDPK